jgi:hypothetical protein
MKPPFTFYRILLMQTEAGNKPMIPTIGRPQARPTVVMPNHLVWFLELSVDEDQDEQCHCTPGSSLFTQGVISVREQITLLGGVRWEQTMEHCRAFSTITMKLLHDLGAIFLW